MTILIAGGDSFTYGSELPSQDHTWANIAARDWEYSICNVAKPAASNSEIRRTVMDAVDQHKEHDLWVCVMWSFPNRYEFRFTYDTGQRDSPWYSINPWTHNDQNFEDHFHNTDEYILKLQRENRANAEKRGISKFARMYIDQVADSEYWELYTSWCEIVMLQNYLKTHGIDYYFMYVDDSLFECNVETDRSLRTLQKEIDMERFPIQQGMFNWAKETKQEFYTTHPKESAHQSWINMLYGRIRYGYS